MPHGTIFRSGHNNRLGNIRLTFTPYFVRLLEPVFIIRPNGIRYQEKGGLVTNKFSHGNPRCNEHDDRFMVLIPRFQNTLQNFETPFTNAILGLCNMLRSLFP